MKCLFLYNPNSGKGKIKKNLNYIERKLRTRYETVDIVATESAEDLLSRVKEGKAVYDAIVFSGGDGTFNYVLRGAEGSGVQLGYIPSGTVNDVARSLRIPRSVKGAIKVILKGNSQKLDCMKIGEDYAMYVVAAGAFTSATYHTDQKDKRAIGALAYAVEGVKHNMDLQVFPLKVTSGGKTVESHAVLLLVMNGRSVAGFPLNANGSMRDGTLETVIIKQVSKPTVFQRIGALFSVASIFVFGCRIKKKDVEYLRGDSVVIETGEDVVWDFDGEEGPRGNITVQAVSHSVNLFVPQKSEKHI